MCAAHLADGSNTCCVLHSGFPCYILWAKRDFHLGITDVIVHMCLVCAGMQAASFDVCLIKKANAPERGMEQHYGKCSNYFDATMLPAAAL